MLDNMVNTIQFGDCYELIKQIPDKSIDLILTDPPYDFHCGSAHGGGIFKNRIVKPGQDIIDLKINKGIDNKILTEFIRIMKHVNLFIWCNKEQIKDYLNFFLSDNISFEILTWHKSNPTPLTKNTYLPDTEYCLYFREKSKVKLNDGYELKHKYWITNTNKDDKDSYLHPTVKPLEIIKQEILHTTQPNDIILDCFCGSGTTCVAAKETGRRFIGMEINPKYYKIAVDRLNGINANGQTSIFTDFDKME